MPLQTIPWHELEPEFIKSWGRPNGKVEAEHISIVGPTGSGKSKFQTYVAKKRAEQRGSHVMIIATKPADSTLKQMHWPITSKWPPEYGKHEQFILWPKAGRDERDARIHQRDMIKEALQSIWTENANTIVVFDEIAYIEQELGLKVLIERYWREGRSLGISIVATTQRPRNVTRYMWSESTWLVGFPPNDEDEAKRVAEILGGRRAYTEELLRLKRHQFILINRREKEAFISKIGT